ncbi:hypothetical protein MA16_Dca024914 [Dendrobium catenatum]|uniref:Uncharacterized protein n=1 Tax=Dendrobium catenatum TaxID=906689 RepID=A0A2I0VI40_9ASPA|nr:hypothetical protein MA16_Dca024914 [Dendrobium catenatum]
MVRRSTGRQAVVKRSPGLNWWSGRATTSGGGPAVVRRNSGDCRGGKEAKAISDLSLFSLDLGSSIKRRWSSIYRFLEWHGP